VSVADCNAVQETKQVEIMSKDIKAPKFEVIQLTQGEIQDAMKHGIHKSKKAYTRKVKHRSEGY